MKRHAGLAISAAICLLLSAVACGSKQDADSDTTAASSVSATEESSETAAATQTPSKKLTAAGTGKPVRTVPAEKVKTYTHSNKVFLLNGYSASLKMENGWEIRSGGTATDQQSDLITSYPAVVQYLDSKDVVTITVLDEVEDKDSFLAGTEDSYLAAYGSAFDSISITAFQQLSIGTYDSFEVHADVVIQGAPFTMIHVISNDVSGKSYSWMLLDGDGKFADFDLVGAISYPVVKESVERIRPDGSSRIRREK